MKKQKNLKQHIGLLLAAGLLLAGTTVSAAENETEQPECMTTEQVEELNLCNTLDEPEPLTVEEATKTYQAGNTVVSFLGDSITTYQDYTDYSEAGNYYNDSIMAVDDTWWMQVLKANDWTLGVNESLGGSRVTWDGVTEDNLHHIGKNYYMASDTRIDKLGKNGVPDKIFVFGGMNDILSQGAANVGNVQEIYTYGKTDDFGDAYYTMITKIEKKYPDAQIICLIPYHTIYSLNYQIIAQDTEKVAAIIKDICEKKDLVALDLRELNLEGQNDMETADYVHPNERGMKKIADFTLKGIVPVYGLVEKDGKYYYYDENGKKVRDRLVEYEGNTWYFQKDGTAAVSKRVDDSSGEDKLYFDENGHMVKDVMQKDPNSDHVWYFDGDGHQVFDTFVRKEKKVYYFDRDGNQFTGTCYTDDHGDVHYFKEDGTMIYNDWYFDGSFTYYLQYDGTPMKDRLTYHPDGEHIIYLDKEGHEVFNNFQYCPSVGYTCYFDSQGYLYKDQITFVGNRVYYLNANGKMEDSGWFQFANGRDYGCANSNGTLVTTGFSYDPYGRVVFYHWNGMVARGLISDGVYYYNMDADDGHYLGQFPVR